MSDSSVLQVFVFKGGQYVGSEIFTEEEISIGSGDCVTLCLDDPQVGANHAILSHANEQCTLLDLGAPSGTMINRTPVQHSYVTPRDEIQIGSHTLKIKFMASRVKATQSGSSRPMSPSPAALAQGAALSDDLSSPEEPTQVHRKDQRSPARGVHVPAQPQQASEARSGRPRKASIDELINGELSRPYKESIEVSGSDVVAARPISGFMPSQQQGGGGGAHARVPAHDAGPTGPIRVPEVRTPEPQPRASKPIADDLYAEMKPSKPTYQPTPPLAQSTRPQAQSPHAYAMPPQAHTLAPSNETSDLDAEDIEESTRPGFSMVQMLRAAERQIRPGSALEVIGFSDDDVRSAELLAKKGERFVLGRGKHREAPDGGYPGLKIAKLVADGTAEIQFPNTAQGWIESQGKKSPLDSMKVPQNAVSRKGDAFRMTLTRGSTATVQFGGNGFYFRFVEPPPIREEPIKFSVDQFIAKAVATSFAVHLTVLLLVALFNEGVSYSDTPREEWAEISQDDLRDVEIKEPEPVPEPEPEPVAEEPEPEPEKPEKAPPPEKKQPKPAKAPPQPKGFTKEEVKSAGVLGAMGKLNLAAPGKKSMVAAVSNIDAVRAPGGLNFRVGALVGKLPSSQVSVGGGGGGKLLTRGGAELLKGGTGFATIGKKNGAVVRGKVDKVNTTRLVAKGSISREEVAAVINKHLAEVQYCYEKTLLKEPGLAGKLILEWTINADGSVGRVKQKTSTLRNPAVATCIISGLQRWTFPKPRGGVVLVSYPFIFSSVGF